MIRIHLCTIAFAVCTALCSAQSQVMEGDVAASGQTQQQQRNFNREVLAKMGVEEHQGRQVPGDVPLKDQHGRDIKFGDLYGSRPIVIMPMWFLCKGVCGFETDALLKTAIQMSDLNVGRDYDIVMLSINPKETPDLVLPRWKTTVKTYNDKGSRPEAEAGFHFLTGTYENIRKITDPIGFKWVYDAKEDTINHPAGIIVLSPSGKITGYLVNNEFPRTFMTHLIEDAKESKISKKTESFLFGCIMIDHTTRKRSLVIENVIRLCAAVFAVGVACWIVGMSVSGNRRKAKGGLA
jgi:protein SCO1